MKNPTKAQVQIVIDNLMKVLPYAQKEDNLDMEKRNISKNIESCGTVLCHGGWYIVSKFLNEETMQLTKEAPVYYNEGAELMAKDLGMASLYESIGMWATRNRDIWYGKNIRLDSEDIYPFSSPMAFYHPEKRPDGAKTLQDIIDHWSEVQSRLPE